MATELQKSSDYDIDKVPDASAMRFAIVTSEWNTPITGALQEGAVEALLRHGAKAENIIIEKVPGSFELVFGASQFVKRGNVDAVIALGCVIRGYTPHFDYVCQGTTQGLAHLNTIGEIPVIYGLITTTTLQQAEARAGGYLGNKGEECAIVAIKMVDYTCKLRK